MSTTTLYAELIVVGSGTVVFILLLFYSVLGDSTWLTKLGNPSAIESVVGLVPVLSVVYLLGILITGVGYLLFKFPETWLRGEKLSGGEEKNNKSSEDKYNKIRNALYTLPDGKNLIEAYEFRRSKIRICRGWFINSFLIIGALLTCLCTGKIPNTTVWFLIITVGMVMIGTVVVWWVATENELGWLQSFDSSK